MLNKDTASLEVSRSQEQRAEPRVREFREFGTASLRGITVLRWIQVLGCVLDYKSFRSVGVDAHRLSSKQKQKLATSYLVVIIRV